jgi:hypothetical protein
VYHCSNRDCRSKHDRDENGAKSNLLIKISGMLAYEDCGKNDSDDSDSESDGGGGTRMDWKGLGDDDSVVDSESDNQVCGIA